MFRDPLGQTLPLRRDVELERRSAVKPPAACRDSALSAPGGGTVREPEMTRSMGAPFLPASCKATPDPPGLGGPPPPLDLHVPVRELPPARGARLVLPQPRHHTTLAELVPAGEQHAPPAAPARLLAHGAHLVVRAPDPPQPGHHGVLHAYPHALLVKPHHLRGGWGGRPRPRWAAVCKSRDLCGGGTGGRQRGRDSPRRSPAVSPAAALPARLGAPAAGGPARPLAGGRGPLARPPPTPTPGDRKAPPAVGSARRTCGSRRSGAGRKRGIPRRDPGGQKGRDAPRRVGRGRRALGRERPPSRGRLRDNHLDVALIKSSKSISTSSSIDRSPIGSPANAIAAENRGVPEAKLQELPLDAKESRHHRPGGQGSEARTLR